jgi:hypothetical protein
MSMSMIPWLLEPAPFEASMKRYLEQTSKIPEPFYPPDRLEAEDYSSPASDSGFTDEQEFFFCSPRVHFEFCKIVDSLVHRAFSTRKLIARSDNFQLFRSFVGPFLICAPHRPWNEYGGNIGTALSPQSLRGLLRYCTLCDFESLQADFDSLGGKDPWKDREFTYFVGYGEFRSYIDRFAALVNEAIDNQRTLLIGVY